MFATRCGSEHVNMSYESELEKGKSSMALVCLDFKEGVARRYVSPMVGRKPTLLFVVPFAGQEITKELVESIRMNEQS